MLTPKQHNLLIFIDEFIKQNGHSPSFEEMKAAVGLKSKSGIHALINSLEERGFIKKLAHKARALEVIKLPKTENTPLEPEFSANDNGEAEFSLMVPLYGKIAAGTPIEAIANPSEYIYIPKSFSTSSELYALTIEGESMVEAGIFDGDTAIIRRSDRADNGQIVVALVDNEEATLKVLDKKSGNEVWLLPCNKSYNPIKLTADRLKIQGVLYGIVRKYS
ncbi:MAG: transcriptional repressor LexA [Alphaproteobacteria bacterium]|nr:transcriptional repressor LexA [Alphaproteobacteria bacterium]MBP3688086.1 transcriptional repressor LexA [Alphaproteobacteria bacterium]